jgi:hypothetical protein
LSIIKLGRDNFERFSVIARPRRTFSSSSAGVTGSVPVFARSSQIEKDIEKPAFTDSAFTSDDPETIRETAISSAGSSNLLSQLESYLSGVNSLTRSSSRDKKMEFLRFEPPFSLNSDFLRKSNIRQNLFQYYRVKNPFAHWSFTNYQSLNFFTSSNVPTGSAIIYDNGVISGSFGPYTPSSGFTLECYLNPRHQSLTSGQGFAPGTIYHLSSTFALSLCSGSSLDSNGIADKFRLMLQVSSSAEARPDAAVSGSYTFFSDDNCLNLNSWHHVAVRWSPTYDNGTGSFVIDGVERGFFEIPDSSISPIFTGSGISDPQDQDALFVGNFYDGTNLGSSGTINFFPQYSEIGSLPQFSLDFPLRAEVHELRIWGKALNDSEIYSYMSGGVGSKAVNGLLFHLPVLFTKESPARDVFLTPFQTTTLSTTDAHNVSMSFGVGGHEINVENFVREFVQGRYPVLYNLTGSEISWNVTDFEEANTLLYATGSFVKRNLTVLPCDNGLTRPDYSLLMSGTFSNHPTDDSPLSKFVNDFGNLDLSIVSLNNLIPTSSLYPGLIASGDDLPSSISEQIEGVGPDSLASGSEMGDVLTIYQRQRDNSSNSVVFFDTSNLFYGGRIHPTSLEIIDSSMTGSEGSVKMTLRDNGRGGLYRADSFTPHAQWAGVGTVLYDEGISVVKSPLIFLFGKDQFEISMRGERQVHVMEITVPCPAGQINSSSNPAFMPLTASDDPNETSVGPVIVTGLNLHDDNLNVVARVSLAQPIIKRSEDRYLFRIKMDW